VPRLAHGLHHLESSGNFFQHRFDGGVPACERKLGAEALGIDVEFL
jgi:hypothetical protein